MLVEFSKPQDVSWLAGGPRGAIHATPDGQPFTDPVQLALFPDEEL
jgi:hypothetical protein